MPLSWLRKDMVFSHAWAHLTIAHTQMNITTKLNQITIMDSYNHRVSALLQPLLLTHAHIAHRKSLFCHHAISHIIVFCSFWCLHYFWPCTAGSIHHSERRWPLKQPSKIWGKFMYFNVYSLLGSYPVQICHVACLLKLLHMMLICGSRCTSGD